jgi:hypothetical protein
VKHPVYAYVFQVITLPTIFIYIPHLAAAASML